MSRPQARVHVTLGPAQEGVTPWRLSNPSQSLLFRFRTGTSEEVLAGAILRVDGGADLAPGDAFSGSLEFWAEDVRPLLRAGEPFVVWYGGDVGTGEVFDVIDET